MLANIGNNYQNNNVNFTARLDLSHIKHNKARWKEIAKMFEAKTPTKDTYNFDISDSQKELSIYATAESKIDPYIEHCVTFDKVTTAKLMDLPNEKITSKLIKLLKVFKDEDRINGLGMKLMHTLYKKDKHGLLDECVDPINSLSRYDAIYFPILDLVKANRNASVAKDAILVKGDYI